MPSHAEVIIWTLTQLSSADKVACISSISLEEGMQGSDAGCSTNILVTTFESG